VHLLPPRRMRGLIAAATIKTSTIVAAATSLAGTLRAHLRDPRFARARAREIVSV